LQDAGNVAGERERRVGGGGGESEIRLEFGSRLRQTGLDSLAENNSHAGAASLTISDFCLKVILLFVFREIIFLALTFSLYCSFFKSCVVTGSCMIFNWEGINCVFCGG